MHILFLFPYPAPPSVPKAGQVTLGNAPYLCSRNHNEVVAGFLIFKTQQI